MAGEGAGFDHPWAALDHAAATAGDREALAFPHEGARLTFAQWRERALAVAGGLAGLGIEAGDHVALLAENRAGLANLLGGADVLDAYLNRGVEW